LGWKSPGYHFIIQRNGQVIMLLPLDRVANGVRGHNANAVHVAYIGGVDERGRALDNRTPEQRQAMRDLTASLRQQFPRAAIKGHRDFPGVTKECPSFDVATWIKSTTDEP
jgi:N-acetylmuramoyl-L-alanine amidase